MTTLPPDIKAAAESAAEKFKSEVIESDLEKFPWTYLGGAWISGVTWLYNHLLTLGGEFDFSGYEDEPSIGTTTAWELTEREIWEGKRESARWQYSQLQPVIAALRAHINNAQEKTDKDFALVRDQNEKLKAELAEMKALFWSQGDKLRAELAAVIQEAVPIDDFKREREINKIYEQALEKYSKMGLTGYAPGDFIDAKEALEKAKGMRGK